jgi:hypothetical protein
MRDIGVNGGTGWIHAFDALETARQLAELQPLRGG